LDAIVCDASFISLKKVLPSGLGFLKTKGWLAALIKPQFEVGKGLVGKGGVVRDPKLHQEVITDIKNWLQYDMNMCLSGVVESPILGPSGNKEFVIVANK
jgi:23S rRNA (cytidine1920-2'-O)/16S rRNA (cytidine1409-2'-O)-methyltransferase